jgi:colanic acid biosynthesis glycosyl transferase WcaI
VGSPSRSREDARRFFGWDDSEIIALHSGNMGSKQNLEVVVDAARRATAAGSPVRFILAGGGNQRPSLERYAAGNPNLVFMDGVGDDDYVDLLRSADVLLVNERPGMTEMSLPSKLTSYLHAGRPIVAATELGGATSEFVTASGGGIVTPAGDSSALLDAVLRIAGAAELSTAFTERGREFARTRLTAATALSAYERWVTDLVAK